MGLFAFRDYYMEKGVNDAGRGLNVIVIDGVTKKVTKRANFDTYSDDSTQFEVGMIFSFWV